MNWFTFASRFQGALNFRVFREGCGFETCGVEIEGVRV